MMINKHSSGWLVQPVPIRSGGVVYEVFMYKDTRRLKEGRIVYSSYGDQLEARAAAKELNKARRNNGNI